MLLQAQGNGDSPAGLRLQRLCTELVRLTPALGQHCPENAAWQLGQAPAWSIEHVSGRTESHVRSIACADHCHGGDADARPDDQGAAALHAADVAAGVDAARAP